MRRTHAYAPIMGKTLREACQMANIPAEAKFLNRWERLTSNPKVRDITETILSNFEDAVCNEPGLGDGFRYRTCYSIKAWLKKIRTPDTVLNKRRRGSPENVTEIDGTLRAYFLLWYDKQRLRGKAEQTRRLHLIAIDRLAFFLGHEPTINDLSDALLNDVMQWCVDRGLAIRSGNRICECLKAQWNFLAKKRVVQEWPTFRAWTVPERSPECWLPSELAQLWKTIRAETGHIGKVPAALFWEALHSVLFDSAERIRAVMALEWSDINLSSRWCKFRAETRKGRAADNDVLLHPKTIQLLRKMRNYDDAKVFPFPYSITYIYNRYKALLRRAGLEKPRAKFHKMRKTTATMWEQAGHNATVLLKHSRRSVTERYLDPRIIQRDHVADILPRPDEFDAAEERRRSR